MTNQEILSQLNLIYTDVIDEGNVELKMSDTAKDVEGWDSLNHVLILADIEKLYGFKFTLLEVQSFKNIEDLVQAIQNKAI